jgi:hypothetical protein
MRSACGMAVYYRSSLQEWRSVVVASKRKTGIMDLTHLGACRDGAQLTSLQLLFSSDGVMQLGVQCYGVRLPVVHRCWKL